MGLSFKKKAFDETENQCSIFIVPEEDEICILCGSKTGISKTAPLNTRKYYVDGCGQLCRECWNELYGIMEIDDFLV